MPVIAVLVTGDPITPVCKLTPDFSTLVREVAADIDVAWVDIDIRECEAIPYPAEFAACIITGSPHSVTEHAPWIRLAEDYLRHARQTETPLFGICFGHQLMASAFGGKVAINPRGREMGTSVAEPLNSPPEGWPEHALDVLMSHRDTVIEAPSAARVVLRTQREPHAALCYAKLCCSTQFHPEFTPEILRCYIEHYREQLTAQGDNVDSLLAQVRETPEARQLLRTFVEAALERARGLKPDSVLAAQ